MILDNENLKVHEWISSYTEQGKLDHPDNEVVKRMGMFKEKSPEIFKPILES